MTWEVVCDSYHEAQTRLLVLGVLGELWIFLRRKIISEKLLLRVLGRKENKIVKRDGMN